MTTTTRKRRMTFDECIAEMDRRGEVIERLEARDIAEFQRRVEAWCIACFGKTTAHDVTERNWRFLEEALELVQSLGGNAKDAHKLVDYVFGREIGEPHQEIGGTMVTLAALVSANGLSIADAAFDELERVERPEIIEKIRRKHAGKPHRSPLPGDYKHAALDDPTGADGSDIFHHPIGSE